MDHELAMQNMMKAAKANLRMTKSVLKSNLLAELRIRKIGTHSLEKSARLVSGKDGRNEKVVVQLTDIAIGEAKKAEIAASKLYRYQKIQAELSLPPGWRRRQFGQIIKSESEYVWKEVKLKHAKKKEHLESIYKPNKDNVDMIEGVKVSDRLLDEEAEDVNIETLAFEVEINEDEAEFLKLPISLAEYPKIDVEQFKTDIQALASKLRMDLQTKENNEGKEMTEHELNEDVKSRMPFDKVQMDLDFGRRRVTDMPNCKRITVPGPCSKETKLQTLISNLEDVVEKAARAEKNGKKTNSCPRAGNRELDPLNEKQARGKKNLLKRQDAGELIIWQIDKGGRLCVSSCEFYKERMMKHIENDPIITRKTVKSSENLLNAASTQRI